MKSKGAIKVFAIALTLVCLFQLSFTVATSIVERNAAQYADGDMERKRNYLDSVAYETVYNIGIASYTYLECKERELNLGLDLRGGMHVTLEVSLDRLLIELADGNEDPTFRKAVERAQEKAPTSQKDFITLFYEEFNKEDPDASLAAIFATRSNRDKVGFDDSNEEVFEFLREEAKSSLSRTFNVLRNRIDRFGVSQPNIQSQEDQGRILIELPGVDDPKRVRRILQSTAKLEFWETFEAHEIINGYLPDVNKVLADIITPEDRRAEEAADDESEAADFFSDEQEETEIVDQDPDVEDAVQEDLLEEDADTAEEDGLLIDEDDTTAEGQEQMTEEEYLAENPLYEFFIPAVNQTDEGTFAREGPVIGYAQARDTAKINKYLSHEKVRRVLPKNLKLAWSANSLQADNPIFELIALKVSTRDGSAPLDGGKITNARVDLSQTGQREVSIAMNTEGAKIWKRLTGDNIGKSVAIVLDGRVYSYPTVNAEISGGRSVIQGRFSSAEAQDLANVLESGKLPIVVNIIEEAIVGPSLGAESINQGLLSLLAGLLLVLVFMVVYYKTGGWVANLALMANLFFILGVLSSLGAALTLPGIAGIVLTIGMSVDANVLIFERIKEELALGLNVKKAVAEGYDKAYSSIIDANLTTLLTAIILYTFGSGPISGFAIILIIGILTSLFSAIFLSRLVFESILSKGKNIEYTTSFSKGILNNPKFNIIGFKPKAYMISAIVVGAGLVSMAFQGFNYGVDFSGGYSYVVRYEEGTKINVSEVRQNLNDAFGEASTPEVKIFGPSNQIRVTTDYMKDSNAEDAAEQVAQKLEEGLQKMDKNFEVMSSQKVGPTIADDIKVAAFWAVLVALIGIFLYIFLRFRNWQYGLGALAAVFHDVLFVLGIFSIFKAIMPFSMEIDQAFIAAILTVVGYSINDTVVVFDRIREKLKMRKRTPVGETFNTALNETLSRTFVTSITTLLVVVILFIFGGEIIRGFAFALMIGVAVGTYSSLFIASSVVIDTHKDDKKVKAKK